MNKIERMERVTKRKMNKARTSLYRMCTYRCTDLWLLVVIVIIVVVIAVVVTVVIIIVIIVAVVVVIVTVVVVIVVVIVRLSCVILRISFEYHIQRPV